MTQNIAKNWGPLRTILRSKCSASLVRKLIGVTGIDMSQLPVFSGTPSTAEYDQLMSALDSIFYGMAVDEQNRFLHILVEEMLQQKPELEDTLSNYLSRLGWQLQDERLVPIDILDLSELPQLPKDATPDLSNAATRLRDGDLSGAVTSACGALDTVTSRIYSEKKLGDAKKASFENKITKSLVALDSFAHIEQNLNDIGWDKNLAKGLIQGLEKSINNAAYVMQTLRSNMGDVHGTIVHFN